MIMAGFRQRGMTLIEILVVLVIIAIISTLMLISVDGRDSSWKLTEQARRLMALTTLQCEQALLESREYAWTLTSQGYQFLEYNGVEWGRSEDRVLKPHRFPVSVIPRLEMNQQTILPAEAEVPHVICFSSGEMTPFSLTLGSGDASVRVRGTITGELELETRQSDGRYLSLESESSS